jgi:hypothetical protein
VPGSTVVPVRASVRDLLTDLLGCAAKVADGQAQQLNADRPSLLAVYRRDDGTAAAACVSDQDFAIRAGAAIGMMPLAEAMPDDPVAGPQGDVLDFFHEVVNVLAKLLNSPTSPHVVLREVGLLPGKVAPEVASLLQRPGQRSDYRITLDGYGDGGVTLLAG